MLALEPKPTIGAMCGKTAIICVIDPVLVREIEQSLSSEGADVIAIVEDGQTAARLALDRRPDFLFVDAWMPDGIGGVQVAELILPQYQTCVIVIDPDRQAAERGDRVGVSGYLKSPIGRDAVRDSARSALKRFCWAVLDQIH